MSLKFVLLVLPCTERVWLRAPQVAGVFNTTLLMLSVAPRSTCAYCGNALLVLSQYVAWLPSLRLPATKPALLLLADAGLPMARLGPPAAFAAATHPTVAIMVDTTAVATTLIRFDRFMAVLVAVGCSAGWLAPL